MTHNSREKSGHVSADFDPGPNLRGGERSTRFGSMVSAGADGERACERNRVQLSSFSPGCRSQRSAALDLAAEDHEGDAAAGGRKTLAGVTPAYIRAAMNDALRAEAAEASAAAADLLAALADSHLAATVRGDATVGALFFEAPLKGVKSLCTVLGMTKDRLRGAAVQARRRQVPARGRRG